MVTWNKLTGIYCNYLFLSYSLFRHTTIVYSRQKSINDNKLCVVYYYFARDDNKNDDDNKKNKDNIMFISSTYDRSSYRKKKYDDGNSIFSPCHQDKVCYNHRFLLSRLLRIIHLPLSFPFTLNDLRYSYDIVTIFYVSVGGKS